MCEAEALDFKMCISLPDYLISLFGARDVCGLREAVLCIQAKQNGSGLIHRRMPAGLV
jgi:hypothetical protein